MSTLNVRTMRYLKKLITFTKIIGKCQHTPVTVNIYYPAVIHLNMYTFAVGLNTMNEKN